MKTVTRTSIVVVAALAWLAALPAWAAGPSGAPSYRYSRMAANPNAQSRVSSRTTAQAAPAMAAPESVATPAPEGQSFPGEGDPSMWEGAYDGGFYDEYGDGGCADGSCGVGTCGTCRRGLWYFSADYLLVRPRLSQGVAEIQQTQQVSVVGTQTSTNTIDNSINYCFAYNSSFRVALGYRLLDCGGDIQFSYWRLTGNAQVGDGPASLSNNQLVIYGQLGNNPGTGDFFNASTGITANIYDLDFAKCLSFGGPQGDCDCSCCPRWDLRFLAGVRIGDVNRYNNNTVTDADGNVLSYGNINAGFRGAGPRIGVQGRRYFGACGKWSVFAKGSQALLIGNYNMSRILTTNTDGETPATVLSQYDSFCRMIPVTDIELGGTWQIAPYAFFSAGWFWQCWWDLGQAENISSGNFGPLDSANILGFDGLFLRGELLF